MHFNIARYTFFLLFFRQFGPGKGLHSESECCCHTPAFCYSFNIYFYSAV